MAVSMQASRVVCNLDGFSSQTVCSNFNLARALLAKGEGRSVKLVFYMTVAGQKRKFLDE